MWIQTNQPSVWNKHSLFDTSHDSWCHLTLAAALWTRCVEHSLQRDPVAGLVSKLLTPPWILPINTHTQMLTTHTHTCANTCKHTQWIRKHLLCHNIVGVQVPPCSLIDSFHGERQLHLITLNLMSRGRSCKLSALCVHFCDYLYENQVEFESTGVAVSDTFSGLRVKEGF